MRAADPVFRGRGIRCSCGLRFRAECLANATIVNRMEPSAVWITAIWLLLAIAIDQTPTRASDRSDPEALAFAARFDLAGIHMLELALMSDV